MVRERLQDGQQIELERKQQGRAYIQLKVHTMLLTDTKSNLSLIQQGSIRKASYNTATNIQKKKAVTGMCRPRVGDLICLQWTRDG